MALSGPAPIAASMAAAEQSSQPTEIRRARLSAATLKQYAMPLTALSDSMTPPIQPTGWWLQRTRARWNQALARVAEVESKITAHEAASPAPAIDTAAIALLGANLRDGLDRADDGRTVEEAHRAHPYLRNRGRYRRRGF